MANEMEKVQVGNQLKNEVEDKPSQSSIGLEEKQNECQPFDSSSAEAACLSVKNNETTEKTGARGGSVPSGIYMVKWIDFLNRSTPIILQNENGPCPLIAIANILLLRKQIEFNPDLKDLECISGDKLIEYLGDTLLKYVPNQLNEENRLNFEQNLSDALSMLDRLQFGLDVNIRFTGVGEFEHTKERNVFDLFNINLFHGWLVDPQQVDIIEVVKNLSYNQLVEKIISLNGSTNEADMAMAVALEDFLESQLTACGLIELQQAIKEHELAVFFRNNHFSTIYKHKNNLYALVTDQGFLRKQIVWETLSTIDGDSVFCDSKFQIYREPKDSALKPNDYPDSTAKTQDDFLLAMSLENPNHADQQYAYMLQEEEKKLARLEQEQQLNTTELSRFRYTDERQKTKKPSKGDKDADLFRLWSSNFK